MIASVLLAAALALAAGQAPVDTVREIRVHGNHTTPDTDIVALAGLTVGSPASADALSAAEQRLRASGRFSGVELRKRFRSLADPSDILVIVLVDERVGVSEGDLTPGPWRRFRLASMWLPVLDYADGYGFSYGARVSFVDLVGSRSRVSVPLTWGGERLVGVDVERRFERGPLTRIEGSLALRRRENPHYDIGDTRRVARLRGERSVTPWLRAGGALGVTAVSFGDVDAAHVTVGADVTVDTRNDPVFPRNALHATLAIEHLALDASGVNRRSADVRGYVGLFGASVLALRATAIQADAPLPPYEQALLGGTSFLRGYRFGYRVGDNLAALAAELRVPLTSPLSFGRFGVKAFVDYGAAYPHGASLGHQTFDRGAGGGVFLTATVLHMGVDIAWPDDGGKPRWHFSLGTTF